MQSDNPEIKALADKIIAPADTDEQKARKIVNWVYRNIRKNRFYRFPTHWKF